MSKSSSLSIPGSATGGSLPDNSAIPLTLLHRVDDAIQKSPHLLGRNLILEAKEGQVVLRGNVDSYFEKQMAQEALRNVEGIKSIQNKLVVVRSH